MLKGMTLSVSGISRVAIVGRNGAGKSTLVRLIAGELRVGSGVGKYAAQPNLKVPAAAQCKPCEPCHASRAKHPSAPTPPAPAPRARKQQKKT